MNSYGPLQRSKKSSVMSAKTSAAALKRARLSSAKGVVRSHLNRGQLPYELHEALTLLLQEM